MWLKTLPQEKYKKNSACFIPNQLSQLKDIIVNLEQRVLVLVSVLSVLQILWPVNWL